MALLKGMAPKGPTGAKPASTKPSQPTVPVKLIYLDAQPPALATLLSSKDKKVADLADQIDARLAWPDKPGVPPPPKVIPLTPAQQKQFDHGKVVFGQTCAACHQPTGLGRRASPRRWSTPSGCSAPTSASPASSCTA